jgi:3-oxoacyl-[acyl-carrier-protein] synthase-3
MKAAVRAIEYHLPAQVLSNDDLAQEFGSWSAEKIGAKTGINERRIAADEECASDLAEAAAVKLFEHGHCAAEDIDFVLLCTQSPDYFLPTTACVLQHRLGLRNAIGAFDFNLGCSGFVYGLGIAKGLIETGQAKRVLLLTAETYSKFINPGDRSVRTLFGDAAAATLIDGVTSNDDQIGPFVYGTDGAGASHLIVPTGGMREARDECAPTVADDQGNLRSKNDLYMNGVEVFNFTLKRVPEAVRALLTQSGASLDSIDRFVFHQANEFMLEHLRRKLGLPQDRFVVSMAQCGNTVSSTIPIALRDAADRGELHAGQRVMVVGFGVGYSWASALLRWTP